MATYTPSPAAVLLPLPLPLPLLLLLPKPAQADCAGGGGGACSHTAMRAALSQRRTACSMREKEGQNTSTPPGERVHSMRMLVPMASR